MKMELMMVGLMVSVMKMEFQRVTEKGFQKELRLGMPMERCLVH